MSHKPFIFVKHVRPLGNLEALSSCTPDNIHSALGASLTILATGRHRACST